jgi:hypothetical protein
MLALLPLGLTAVAAGLSAGAIAGAVYAIIAMDRVVGVPVRSMLSEIWPPAVASILMALILLPLDREVLEPASHGTFVGLCLLAVEGILGCLIFATAMRVLAPGTMDELRELVAARLRRPASAAR